MNCPGCGGRVAEADDRCPHCGDETPAGAATRTSSPTLPGLSATATGPTPAVALPDEEEPRPLLAGEILASRYRVVERLGEGGMGEVYRAEDLTLDQPVALKFLSRRLAGDRTHLKQFRREVGNARRIAHPHVCRVYEIGEIDGRAFLSMEYVRGEDLRTLLRRIGRLSPDKALALAGQLASGLAAVHEKGILHRDLKPANVLLDERGQALIVDFGLAAAADSVKGADIRSGTVSYMAPEQRAGREVSERSDLYSLGLILYELFTGRRAFEGPPPEDAVPAAPSQVVAGIDPAVDRLVLWCLEPDPQRRPASARAVLAALPGPDPLAKAVARGETPAPGLVAEAGRFAGLRPRVAWACLAVVALCLTGCVWLSRWRGLATVVPLPRSPELLEADARRILHELGHGEPPRDWTSGFLRDTRYIDHLVAAGERNLRAALARGEPSVVRFWYRESPEPLVPHRLREFYAAEHDPPNDVPGMRLVHLDPRGWLRRLEVVPASGADPPPPANGFEWSIALRAAGLDPAELAPAEPSWAAANPQEAAWTGSWPDAPDVPIRVEAAALGGRLVRFRVFEPWSPAVTAISPWVRASNVMTTAWGRWLHAGLHLCFLLGLAALARHNLRSGRGDLRFAFRLGGFFFALELLSWLLGAHHVADRAEVEILYGGLERAFAVFGMAWLFYVAVEPWVRRLWPRVMISWVRLLDGRFDDPRVGRDVLAGCVGGAVQAFWFRASHALGARLGAAMRPDVPWHPAELVALHSLPEAIAQVFTVLANSALHVLFLLMALLLLRALLRRDWLAVALHWTLYTLVYGPTFGFPFILFWISIWYLLFFRFGWVSVALATTVAALLGGFPLTSNAGAWHVHATVVAVGACAAVTWWGFKVALAGRPAFGDLFEAASPRNAA